MKSLQSLKFQGRELFDGEFLASGLPEHVASLCLRHCKVTLQQDCKCVISLQRLHMSYSTLSGLDHAGISACCALQWLQSLGSAVMTDLMGDRLEMHIGHDVLFPTQLFALGQLRIPQLDFYLGAVNDSVDSVDISCLYSLTALHSLKICCEAGNLVVSSGLLKLS